MPVSSSARSTRAGRHSVEPAEAVRRARELHAQGRAAAAAARNLSGIRLLRQGLALVDTAGVDPVERIEVRTRLLMTLSFCLAETSGLDAGLAQLAIAREALIDFPDPALGAELLSMLNGNNAALLFRVGRLEEGIRYVDLDVAYHEKSLAHGGGDPGPVAQSLVTTLTNRGNAYGELDQPQLAVRDLNRAFELAVAHDLPIRAGIAKHALGNVLQRAGDIPAALRRYEEANKIFLDLEPSLLLRLRIDQAEAMISVGLADEAGRHLDDTLPALRRQRTGQDVAEAELLRATAALLDGQNKTARRIANSVRGKLERRGSPGRAAMAGLIALRVDARRALAAKRPPAKLPEQALALSAQLCALSLFDEAALAHVLAALLEVRLGNAPRAEELLATVPRSRRIRPIDHRLLMRLCRAELALAQKSRRGALAQAKAGLTELGRVRDRLGGPELVSGTALHGRELGDLAIRLVLDGRDCAADAKRLFTWLERTRAQMYRYDPLESTVDTELAERIAEVRQLSRALRRARLDGLPTATLERRYAVSQRDATRLGWSANPWGKPRPVATPEEVIARLGDRALISFAASRDDLVAVVIAGGRMRLVRLGSAEVATEGARKLHADLNALAPDRLPAAFVHVISASARREANRLDEQLLRPLASMVGDRELIIVPTGALHVVPWSVLASCGTRPTTVVPSATAWLAASRVDCEPSSGVVLIHGPGLNASPGEIDKLARYHRNATVLGTSEAKVGSVLAALDGVGLAHIAAHGEHEPENALFSRLELVDGALFAHEVGRVRRPPHQVVLAACELALNRIRPGDEPLGFAGAMLAGGVHTVIAASSR
ncbi:MAG: CHAT domain-containing protein, partial [Actinomycetota bacterium]|nr:CHAT domain-containing protein [Actinomycetota bacterium]